MFGIAVLIAISAPWRLRWRDDVHELDMSSPGLAANDDKLRALFGENSDQSLYLTFGRSPAEARDRLEAFTAYESGVSPPARLASLGLVFPTEADWRAMPERLGSLGEFARDFRAALERRGFDSAAFGAFFDDWNDLQMRPPSGDYAGLYRGLDQAMDGPMAQLYQVRGPLPWFITIVERPDGPAPPPRFSTVSLDELQSLNRVFTRYRWSALRLSLIGLGLVIASVFIIYPFRAAVRIAVIPAGSCFFALGVLALAGVTPNLFHLLGAFLGLCLAHNYAIFSSESARKGQAPAVAIRLSAACAAASFAVLACSRIPAVHALGGSVLLIVLTAMAAVELEPLARGNAPPG
jgi:predicted exporter